MALAHNLGFPPSGCELQQALAAYRQGKLDAAGLRAVGRELRTAHWQLQKDAGIELLPVGDFVWFDQVFNHSLLFGVVPASFRDGAGRVTRDGLFAMVRDGAQAQEMARRFDTDEHYLVPEFSADQQFRLSWEQLFEEVEEALALGHTVKPVLLGPLTYLWLGKAKGDEFDKLELLERLLPVYGEVLGRLAGLGVDWVQIDEPILGLDLPQAWRTAFERAYNLLQQPRPQKLLTTCYAGLAGNLGLAANLPVAGLHVDLVRAPEQFPAILDRLPAYKVLSLGVVDGHGGWRCDLEQALAVLRQAQERVGERLWVAPSCALLHSPPALDGEGRSDAEPQDGLAFVVRKCNEVAGLARALNQPQVQAA